MDPGLPPSMLTPAYLAMGFKAWFFPGDAFVSF